MTRRAKIVCTVGPATADPGAAAGAGGGGHGRRPAQLQPRRPGRPRAGLRPGPGGVRPGRPGGRRAGRPAGPEDPARPVRRRAGASGAPASGSRSPPRTCPAPHDRVSTTYQRLADDVRPGDRLLVDDGNVALVVIDVDGPDVRCDVVEGGPVSRQQGPVAARASRSACRRCPTRTPTTCGFALGLGVDLVALSFVRSPADVAAVQAVMDGGRLPACRCWPSWRSRRRSPTSTRWSTPSTG